MIKKFKIRLFPEILCVPFGSETSAFPTGIRVAVNTKINKYNSH
jgi:hypothetical protein